MYGSMDKRASTMSSPWPQPRTSPSLLTSMKSTGLSVEIANSYLAVAASGNSRNVLAASIFEPETVTTPYPVTLTLSERDSLASVRQRIRDVASTETKRSSPPHSGHGFLRSFGSRWSSSTRVWQLAHFTSFGMPPNVQPMCDKLADQTGR